MVKPGELIFTGDGRKLRVVELVPEDVGQARRPARAGLRFAPAAVGSWGRGRRMEFLYRR
jgi:hypothetical protein